jgi:hypothetical protein
MSATIREEFERLIRANRTKTAASAVQALTAFVAAADKLNDEWDDSLDEGYPRGLPSFDELVDQLHQWARKAKS